MIAARRLSNWKKDQLTWKQVMARGAILQVTKRHIEKIPPAPFAKGGEREAPLLSPPLLKVE
jgi:hypothetical protein